MVQIISALYLLGVIVVLFWAYADNRRFITIEMLAKIILLSLGSWFTLLVFVYPLIKWPHEHKDGVAL